ncbi:MAG: dihydrolipoamide acetyltransferase family protein [Acidimicrobiia bacterium]
MAYELKLPDMGEGLTEAEIVRWLVKPGDQVELNAPLVEVETDKAVVEIPSPQAGVLLHRGAAEGEVVRVGALLAVIGDPGEQWQGPGQVAEPPARVERAEEDQPPAARPPGSKRADQVSAVPAVRKLARDLGVDLATVPGTGEAGQITRADVVAAAEQQGAREGEERRKMSQLRRTIARNLSQSWREIPHVTVFGPAEATRMLEGRRELSDRLGFPVPLDALIVGAVLPVLRSFPEFNASVDEEAVVIKQSYNIGVAVDTPDGLIVPVVKDADALDLAALAREVARLIDSAQRRTVSLDELLGGTFTVSNVGAVGGGYGTPIIPPGTTAILSVGRASNEVVVRDGKPVVAQVFPLSLSFDHRVIDGALASRFLAEITGRMERPFGGS